MPMILVASDSLDILYFLLILFEIYFISLSSPVSKISSTYKFKIAQSF